MHVKSAENNRSRSIKDNERNASVGIIIFPLHKGSRQPLSNLINVIDNLSVSIKLVTGSIEKNLEVPVILGNLVHIDVYHEGGSNLVSRVLRYALTQLKLSIKLCILTKHTNTWIFFLGGENLIIPMLTAKLLGKHVILTLGGSSAEIAKYCNDTYSKQMLSLFRINASLADSILVYSKSLIKSWQLEEYGSKIFIAREHFLDFNIFTVTVPLSDRPPLVGYTGRLSGEKGIQNFTRALPTILSDRRDLRVLIGGDGPLKKAIATCLQEGALSDRVDLPGWLSHDDLPRYLNQLRLLVLPSYTEGLPNIMLEAMACGTPVLATPVGAIPDVIIDGKTGFIMENNSPECIAENVTRALSSPDLDRIAEAGRRFVEENFTFEKTVENWKSILQSNK